MNGGVGALLLGRGDGEFTPVRPDRSGIVMAGDAKGLASVDLNGDGWVDFTATQNDGPMEVFLNGRVKGRRMLSLILRGRHGNTGAAGARVTVRCADLPNQTSEVYAGSGYLSQSGDNLFFALGESENPIGIEIRWPDGSTTVRTYERAENPLVITQQ
jgi:hypothetical protein